MGVGPVSIPFHYMHTCLPLLHFAIIKHKFCLVTAKILAFNETGNKKLKLRNYQKLRIT